MNYHEIKLISRDLRKNQTPYEKQLWRRIRDRQLNGFKFLRQHPIVYDRHGNDLNVFIPDFYCPKVRLAIELDGGVHDNTRDHDEWREEILGAMEINVLRIKNEELVDMERVVDRIRGSLLTLGGSTLHRANPPTHLSIYPTS
jgi:very-short-patch-repair endonuclease